MRTREDVVGVVMCLVIGWLMAVIAATTIADLVDLFLTTLSR
jgi:hypothetical protein